MKAVVFVALIALVGLVAAQAPTAGPTKCDTILSVIGAATNVSAPKITTANEFLVSVVGTTVGLLQTDIAQNTKSSLFRYFNGSAPYPNIFNSQSAATTLVGKLVDWFSNYLGCAGPENVISLTASHASLKISRSDAVLFNTRVMGAIVAVLQTQGVAIQGAVVDLAGVVAGDLAALIPTYTVNDTATFCDKYANQLTLAGYNTNLANLDTYGAVDFSGALGEDAAEFTSNLALRGPGYAFWFFFVKRGVVLNELVSNATVNARLAVYFNGSRGTPNFFANGGANANLGTLINKLVAWFGVLTGCSDAEFRAWAQSTAAVNTNGPINLSLSHQGLRITAADNDLFNTAILRQAGNYLTQFGLTSAEGSTVAGLLNSVSSQVVYQPPAPAAPPTTAAAPTAGAAPTAPKAPSVATPKAAAGSVVASIGLVAVALLALLF